MMADLSEVTRAVEEAVGAIHEAALGICLDATVDAAPERTGALKNSLRSTPSSLSGFVASGSIYSDLSYAGFTDAGTEPHLIEGNPLLHFYWDKVGREVWFHYVNHPGTTGTQWFNAGEPDGDPMRSRWQDACEQANGVAA